MPATATNDLTRQQLDELDQLLQRMLSMPLSQPESRTGPVTIAVPPPPVVATPEVPVNWRQDAPRPEPASPHLLPAFESSREMGLQPLESQHEESLQPMWTPSPLQSVRKPEPAEDRLAFVPPPTEPIPNFEKLNLDHVTLTTVTAEPQSSTSTLPMWSWPIAISNWLLETTLKLFGPPGAALTRPAMKMALGVAGLLMIAGAAAWAAQGQGWIQLPVDKLMKR